MKLPNAENAVVDLVKLVDYCLSTDHPRGKHKARVFQSACGLTAQHAELLRQQLLDAAEEGDAVETNSDTHGRRFVIECNAQGPNGEAAIRTAWIVRPDEDVPRFVSAYVK
jgi:hypothetical protein